MESTKGDVRTQKGGSTLYGRACMGLHLGLVSPQSIMSKASVVGREGVGVVRVGTEKKKILISCHEGSLKGSWERSVRKQGRRSSRTNRTQSRQVILKDVATSTRYRRDRL